MMSRGSGIECPRSQQQMSLLFVPTSPVVKQNADDDHDRSEAAEKRDLVAVDEDRQPDCGGAFRRVTHAENTPHPSTTSVSMATSVSASSIVIITVIVIIDLLPLPRSRHRPSTQGRAQDYSLGGEQEQRTEGRERGWGSREREASLSPPARGPGGQSPDCPKVSTIFSTQDGLP